MFFFFFFFFLIFSARGVIVSLVFAQKWDKSFSPKPGIFPEDGNSRQPYWKPLGSSLETVQSTNATRGVATLRCIQGALYLLPDIRGKDKQLCPDLALIWDIGYLGMQRNVTDTGHKSVQIFSAIKYGMFSLHTFFCLYRLSGLFIWRSWHLGDTVLCSMLFGPR